MTQYLCCVIIAIPPPLLSDLAIFSILYFPLFKTLDATSLHLCWLSMSQYTATHQGFPIVNFAISLLFID